MSDKLHIFAVSDSVGETAEKIAVASALQFEVDRNVTRFSRATKKTQVQKIIEQAVAEDAIIIYTIVKPELSEYLQQEAAQKSVTAVNVLEPLFNVIQEKTGLQPANISGLTRTVDDQYFNRMQAIEYTLEHDNGQNPETIGEANLIILGLPRTSKTPLSMHLANLGIKVANYPITMDTEIPQEIIDAKGKIPMVGLTIDLDALMNLRRERFRSFEQPGNIQDLDELVAEELDNAYSIYAKLKCLVIDVTMVDIETVGNTITHKFNLPLRVTHHKC